MRALACPYHVHYQAYRHQSEQQEALQRAANHKDGHNVFEHAMLQWNKDPEQRLNVRSVCANI